MREMYLANELTSFRIRKSYAVELCAFGACGSLMKVKVQLMTAERNHVVKLLGEKLGESRQVRTAAQVSAEGYACPGNVKTSKS